MLSGWPGTCPPRDQPYPQEAVLDAVASLHPAIEIPDSRFLHFERVGLAQLVADNACAHRFILGPAASADWRALDLAGHKGRMFRNGAGGWPRKAPAATCWVIRGIALTWLANELSRHGETLKAGQPSALVQATGGGGGPGAAGLAAHSSCAPKQRNVADHPARCSRAFLGQRTAPLQNAIL